MKSSFKGGKIIILISVLVFVMVAFFVGVNFTYAKNTTKFYDKTVVNGVDVSNMTIDEAVEALTKTWNKNTFKFSFDDNKYNFEVPLGAVDLTYNVADELKALMSEPSYVEKLKYFVHLTNEYTINMVSDGNNKFVERISGYEICNNTDREPTKNAYVDLSTLDFNVVKEVIGTEVDPVAIQKIALENIAEGVFEAHISMADIVKQPEITADSEDIKKDLDYANNNLTYKIEYNFGSEKYTLTPADIDKMAKYSEDGSVDLKEKKIKKFVSGLADKYNETGKTYNFKTHSGKVKKVEAVSFGKVLNEEAEIEYLKKALSEKKSDTHKPDWSQSPYKLTDINDGIGDSYIEVSIGAQHVWCYKDGELMVECDCVSGQPPHNTHTGVFTIQWVSGPMTLRGYNDDGSKYESPVNCFMPFWDGQGLHGSNNWRGSWGGNIYQYNGSHGCVNCPDKAAWTMHNIVCAGYPVVIY